MIESELILKNKFVAARGEGVDQQAFLERRNAMHEVWGWEWGAPTAPLSKLKATSMSSGRWARTARLLPGATSFQTVSSAMQKALPISVAMGPV